MSPLRRRPLNGSAYCELLGWYLGDGHISLGRRGVYNLHIYNDVAYPVLNSHILDLMRLVKPGGRPHTRMVPGCVISTVSWKHWPCLFPQHGPGRKHERPILLESWQVELVDEFPGDFLRGLFHSDGCRANNWASALVAGELKRYDYPRWHVRQQLNDISTSAARPRLRARTSRLASAASADHRRCRPSRECRRLDALIGLKA